MCWCTVIHTVEPGYGDAFKEDQEEQGHSTGRVVVEQFEHIKSTLAHKKKFRIIIIVFFFFLWHNKVSGNFVPV